MSLKRTIFIICGPICSGKQSYFDLYFDTNNYTQIVVSDIVKDLIGKKDRASLQDTANLDEDIIERLAEYIAEFEYVVIDGIRQLSILEGLEYVFSDDTFIYVWLEVDEQIRRERFKLRGALKDKELTFDQAEERDRKLGLDELQKALYTPERKPTLRRFNEHGNRI